MAERNYWLDLFTGQTWQEFVEAGTTTSGFRESRWKTVSQIRPGDYLICYLTGVSRFIALLEVVSPPYRDKTPIWAGDLYPCRMQVTVVASLTPETAVPVHELSEQLSMFRDMRSPIAWTGRFRGSPSKWKPEDGEVVVAAVTEASRNPVSRPVDAARLARRPRGFKAKIGSVTVPGTVESEAGTDEGQEHRIHSEVQWLLLKLGCDMGLDVWVARNDRGRSVNGSRFADLRSLKAELPLQFDDATNRTIELIDVLWLQGNAIAAAFEIESTTSIYSGLLRMSDLMAMQPNLNIPLYLVAPEERRNKVIAEVNRPTFSRLHPPMSETCRFISFSTLHRSVERIAEYVRHLKPDFLAEISESCEIEDV